MKLESKEMLCCVAAAWAFAFIVVFLMWWSGVSYTKPEDAGLYVCVWLFLAVGAVTGMGYLFWWFSRDTVEEREYK